MGSRNSDSHPVTQELGQHFGAVKNLKPPSPCGFEFYVLPGNRTRDDQQACLWEVLFSMANLDSDSKAPKGIEHLSFLLIGTGDLNMALGQDPGQSHSCRFHRYPRNEPVPHDDLQRNRNRSSTKILHQVGDALSTVEPGQVPGELGHALKSISIRIELSDEKGQFPAF